jgi:hypothetical protein
MSLEVQIEGLQILSKHQKQRSKTENMKRRKKTFVIFCVNCFEKKTQTPNFFIACKVVIMSMNSPQRNKHIWMEMQPCIMST